MAKREIKAVQASSDVAAIVDRGADVDVQIKNLGFEDKGLKTKITEAAQNQLNPGELSVRLIGKTAAAVVSGVEKIELDVSAESFSIVREAILNGLMTGIVERNVSLIVPPGDVEKAAEVLKTAGIRATVTESIKIVDSDILNNSNYAVLTQAHLAQAVEALRKCVKKDVSFRVKYEKN